MYCLSDVRHTVSIVIAVPIDMLGIERVYNELLMRAKLCSWCYRSLRETMAVEAPLPKTGVRAWQ